MARSYPEEGSMDIVESPGLTSWIPHLLLPLIVMIGRLRVGTTSIFYLFMRWYLSALRPGRFIYGEKTPSNHAAGSWTGRRESVGEAKKRQIPVRTGNKHHLGEGLNEAQENLI